MAQDTTPSIIMYQGGTNTFPVPFDKGYYGEVKVLFVRRGATGYEYEPASSNYVVSGRLYAWGAGSNYIYTHTPTPAVEAPIYNDQDADSGKKVEVIAGQTITVDGVSYVRATQHDISNHLILTWNGEELGVDDYICIGRDTERGQPYSLPNNQKHIEGALDNIERQVQELKDKTDNALVVDPTHTIDASKMGPIDWLETIVRSTDKTARAIRYHNGYLQFSLEDPEIPLNQKTWTSILNTINVTTIREWYDEEKNEYRIQYSKDNGVSWKELPFNISSIPGLENRLVTIENEQAVLEAGVKGNADAIQKTRDDYIAADSEIHKILNSHTSELTTLRGNQASLGDQVSGIEGKIPESASGTNPLITKQQLLDKEMDIREDMNQTDSELQSQITAQAAAIAGKQDKLTAGDNIIISNNVISATGTGGAGFDAIVVQELPESGLKGVIYLVPSDGETPDVYDEYLWIESTGTFELIGSTKVDLSNYLPLSGGTLTGPLTITAEKTDYSFVKGKFLKIIKESEDGSKKELTIYATSSGIALDGLDLNGVSKLVPVGDKLGSLGQSFARWGSVYTTIINNGADIAIPTEGGTLARLEDLENIDALPDQTGNAGKFLKTDGTTATWEDVPPSVTITLKEYDE
jgi:hypothetical protein